MDVVWIIVTVLVVVAVIAMWLVFEVRGQLISRAARSDPETARALREVQRQIDAGYSHSDLARRDANF